MFHATLVFRDLKLVPALAATVVVAGAAAPSASADTLPTVWLNAQGALSYTGTTHNDIVDVDKGVLVLCFRVATSSRWRHGNGRRPSSPRTARRGAVQGDWLIKCPASLVNRLTFDGQAGGDGFNNPDDSALRGTRGSGRRGLPGR